MKYIVPVSGGKDSQVCLAWALDVHRHEDIVPVHQYTGYDHPDTMKHLKYMERRYGVNIQFTKSKVYRDIFDFIRKAGYFPNSVARGCTSRLKQEPFGLWILKNNYIADNAHIYLGMRSDESASRENKYGQLDPTDIFTLTDLSSSAYPVKKFGNTSVSLPIVQWTAEDVFAFLKKRGDKVNPLYARGHHRVGCYPCLLARNQEWEAAARDPIGRKHIKELLDIEQEFIRDKNPRKLIKIHQSRDVKKLYEEGGKCDPTADSECGWCSI